MKGLLSHDGGRTFAIIRHEFLPLGNVVQYRVLNASYYGVRQKRERVIVVGVREDLREIVKFVYLLADAN